MTDAVIAHYTQSAAELAARYDAISPDALYAPLSEWLPTRPARVADIGAGTGRDARWFASRGHTVTAIDPVPALRRDPCARDITWIKAALPDAALDRMPFAFITLSAVWHHIPDAARPAAMAQLRALTAAGGICAMSLRSGAADHVADTCNDLIWEAPVAQTSALAAASGFDVQAIVAASPQQKRNRDAGVRFTWLVLQAPRHAAPDARSATS